MAKVISVALQKGGSAKSSTAQVISDIYGSQGKRVLLIDCDPQRNTSYTLGAANPDKSLTDVLYGNCEAEEAIIKCEYHDLIPADRFLNNVQTAIVDTAVPDSVRQALEDSNVMVVSLSLLKDKIKSILNSYDLIILDTPPNLGNLSIMGLIASDFVVIPSEVSPYVLIGISDLMQTVDAVKRSYNSSLTAAGILLIKYNKRTTLSSDVKEILDKHEEDLGLSVFDTTIRNGIDLTKSQMEQISLLDYAPRCNVLQDYKDFCDELGRKIGV